MIDIEDLRIMTQNNERLIAPYRTTINNLIAVIVILNLCFGGCFGYFMYKAFSTDAGNSISNEHINYAVVDNVIGE